MDSDETNQETEQTTDSAETEAAPETVAVPEVPNQPSIEEVRAIYNSALQAASQRAQAAEQEAERLRSNQQAQPQPTQEESRQQFFDNPRELIRQEMQEVVRPLNDFQRNFSRQQALQEFFQRAQGQTAFQYLANPQVSNALIQVAGTMPEINDNALIAAYNMIVGHLFSTGALTPNTNAARPTSTEPTVQPPATPRPNAPLPPVSSKQKRRTLNEHEKQLARFNNMTEDSYLDFLEMDKSQVTNYEGAK